MSLLGPPRHASLGQPYSSTLGQGGVSHLDTHSCLTKGNHQWDIRRVSHGPPQQASPGPLKSGCLSLGSFGRPYVQAATASLSKAANLGLGKPLLGLLLRGRSSPRTSGRGCSRPPLASCSSCGCGPSGRSSSSAASPCCRSCAWLPGCRFCRHSCEPSVESFKLPRLGCTLQRLCFLHLSCPVLLMNAMSCDSVVVRWRLSRAVVLTIPRLSSPG